MSDERPYEDYNENEFVESMGGRDLMAGKDDPHTTSDGLMNTLGVMNTLDHEYVSAVEEQRRVAAVETAKGLGVASADDLIKEARKIEKYLKGDTDA